MRAGSVGRGADVLCLCPRLSLSKYRLDPDRTDVEVVQEPLRVSVLRRGAPQFMGQKYNRSLRGSAVDPKDPALLWATLDEEVLKYS
jgi:hypothetical protein